MLDLLKDEALLADDDVRNISTEKKRCQYIYSVLQCSSLICFRKFILLLDEKDLHVNIIVKIVEGIVISCNL